MHVHGSTIPTIASWMLPTELVCLGILFQGKETLVAVFPNPGANCRSVEMSRAVRLGVNTHPPGIPQMPKLQWRPVLCERCNRPLGMKGSTPAQASYGKPTFYAHEKCNDS